MIRTLDLRVHSGLDPTPSSRLSNEVSGLAVMLKWCSYCQQFKGEVPDYKNLVITHGMCGACGPRVPRFSESDFVRAETLRDIQGKLFGAGRSSDLSAARSIIDDAIRTQIRPVDILMGLVAPMLYQIGEEWRLGTLSVERERRFTAFCEEVFDLVAPIVTVDTSVNPTPSDPTEVVLINAPGNTHTLATRILATWMKSRGAQATIADENTSTEALVELIRVKRCKLLMISMALAEQRNGVISVVEGIAKMPTSIRPKVIVGGFAVKLGLVAPISGADLIGDISALNDLP